MIAPRRPQRASPVPWLVGIVVMTGLGFYAGFGAGKDAANSEAETAPFVPELLSIQVDRPPKPVKPTPTATIAAAVAASPVVTHPPTPARIPLIKNAPKGRFGLQVGAFQSTKDAQSYVESHREAIGKLPVFVLAATIKGRGTWYRVRIGAERNKLRARKLKASLPKTLAKSALVVVYK